MRNVDGNSFGVELTRPAPYPDEHVGLLDPRPRKVTAGESLQLSTHNQRVTEVTVEVFAGVADIFWAFTSGGSTPHARVTSGSRTFRFAPRRVEMTLYAANSEDLECCVTFTDPGMQFEKIIKGLGECPCKKKESACGGH